MTSVWVGVLSFLTTPAKGFADADAIMIWCTTERKHEICLPIASDRIAVRVDHRYEQAEYQRCSVTDFCQYLITTAAVEVSTGTSIANAYPFPASSRAEATPAVLNEVHKVDRTELVDVLAQAVSDRFVNEGC